MAPTASPDTSSTPVASSNETTSDSRAFYDSAHYLGAFRWTSYWHQIAAVLDSAEGGAVLEAGVGNGIVSGVLRSRCRLTTFDVDPALSPDVVGDVRQVDELFGEAEFRVVLCAEVLEHLPFEDFVPTLVKLRQVLKEKLILGLPHSGPSFSAQLKLPLLPELAFAFKLPWPVRHPPGGEHFWEIGKRGTSLRAVCRAIRSAGFTIDSTYVVPGSPYHRMFVLSRAPEPGGNA